VIIPLGHGSRRDSSSLPEGCSQRWIAPSSRENALCSDHREAVVCTNVLGEPGRLSPPIWPCTTRGFPCLRCCHRSGGLLPHLFTLAKLSERFVDVPQVFLRDATVLLSAGGIFSVALSVNRSTGPSAGLKTRHYIRATVPLALPGALPYFVTGSCEPTTTVSGLSSRSAILRCPSQRSPGSPANRIVADWLRIGEPCYECVPGVGRQAEQGGRARPLHPFFVTVASKRVKLTLSAAKSTSYGRP
jgi:hypothetical protein